MNLKIASQGAGKESRGWWHQGGNEISPLEKVLKNTRVLWRHQSMVQLLVHQRRTVLPPTTPWCQLMAGITDTLESAKRVTPGSFFLSLAAGWISVSMFACAGGESLLLYWWKVFHCRTWRAPPQQGRQHPPQLSEKCLNFCVLLQEFWGMPWLFLWRLVLISDFQSLVSPRNSAGRKWVRSFSFSLSLLSLLLAVLANMALQHSGIFLSP